MPNLFLPVADVDGSCEKKKRVLEVEDFEYDGSGIA